MIVPSMTPAELALRLRKMYSHAARGEAVTNIHLFGIKYANEIAGCGASPAEIVRLSGIPESYVTEVGKGIRLASRVTITRDPFPDD